MKRRTLLLFILGAAIGAALVAVRNREQVSEFVGEAVDSVNDAIKNLIAKFEGYSATVYQDVAGLWTIGYGHLVKPSDPYHPYGRVTEITQEEAEQLLESDTEEARLCVAQNVVVPLTDNQRAALVSFVFNVGCGAFRNSTLLRVLNQGRYESAAAELDRWVHAGGVRVAGLVKRRQLEKETFLA